MMMQPMEFAILGKNKKEEIFFVSLSFSGWNSLSKQAKYVSWFL